MRVATMTSLFRECRESNEFTGYIESIRLCKEAGFSVLDLNMCSMLRRQTELNGDDWIKNAEEIRNEAEKLGITFSQSHPPYRPFKGSRFKSTEEKECFDELTHRAIHVSSILGVKWAVMHPVTEIETAEFNLEADLAANHENFDKVVEQAAKENVGIAFENMCDRDNRRRFGATAEELIALVDSYKGAPVGICWDTGHGHRVYTNQIPALEKMGSHIKALHINDNFGQDDLHLLPFLGTIPWEKVMKTLTQIGYEGDLVYEIRINNYMPEGLKIPSARFSVEVGNYLLSLC